jgi:hypothetical protein
MQSQEALKILMNFCRELFEPWHRIMHIKLLTFYGAMENQKSVNFRIFSIKISNLKRGLRWVFIFCCAMQENLSTALRFKGK